jgi:hypothetical protein
MPFLGAETALPCAGGRQVGHPLAPPAQNRRISGGRDSGRHFAGVYRPAAAGLRIRASENRLAVAPRLRAVFRRKGTDVHEQPVSGWIWCTWNERQNVGTWTKLSPLAARDPGPGQ